MFGTERMEEVLRGRRPARRAPADDGGARGGGRLRRRRRAVRRHDAARASAARLTARPASLARGELPARSGERGDAPRRASRRWSKSPENPEIVEHVGHERRHGAQHDAAARPSRAHLRTARKTRRPALETYSLPAKSATSLRAPPSSSPSNSASTSPGAGRVDPRGQRDDGHVADGLDLHRSLPFLRRTRHVRRMTNLRTLRPASRA